MLTKIKSKLGFNKKSSAVNLTEGPIIKSILMFAIPLFMGQLLQQFYNMADAWVIGNYADNDAFAAVSSAGSMTFLIVGLFNGIAIGGGVIISRYYGAGDEENVVKAIHTNFLMGIIASVASTIVGLLLSPHILRWMNTPASVLPNSLTYFRIYFAGVSTVIMYNICMSIMRALGDSLHPLYYLIISSIVNVVLDMLFVAGFHWGVAGAAIATVIAQGLSVVLCLIRLCRIKDYTRLDFRKIHFYKDIMGEVVKQGLPTGIQNAVISIGNLTVQTNINSFGSFAMAGVGAYSKIEGFVFLPIMSMSMSLPTFVSQNLGAKQYSRAKKGAAFGILFGVVMAELLGVLIYFGGTALLRIFVDTPESIEYGMIHMKVTALFFFLLALSHCAAGVLRGLGKAFIPMVTMLAFWCGVRVLYVSLILKVIPEFQMISWAYPLTWSLSAVLFTIILLRMDWTKAFNCATK
ncbi:MAG: MATE family efflux transporter [Lachnospiraceae bacterium]|nr:MATE family efflux transporter [Lachnospiraceae bacterium]MBQ9123159.1 MATE family efflux transporter [Lachnospiraceae bacterium]